MRWIFVAFCFFGTIAVAVFVKSMNLHGALAAAIIIPLILLTIYSLAKVQPESSKTKTEVEEGSHILSAAEASK